MFCCQKWHAFIQSNFQFSCLTSLLYTKNRAKFNSPKIFNKNEHFFYNFFSNNFCDAEQVSFLRYSKGRSSTEYVFILYSNICLSKFNCWSASVPGRVAQSVTCLATDACLTADPGVASSIPVRSHTFVEIDHEIISTVILLLSADLFKKGCCQLQAKVCARITG